MTSEIPALGVVYWPVGRGVSPTIVVSGDMQDLDDRANAVCDRTPEVHDLRRNADRRPFLDCVGNEG